MNYLKWSKAFRSFAEGFTLLAEALEEDTRNVSDPEPDETPEVPEEEKKTKEKAKDPALKKNISKKVWDEEPPEEKEPGVIELEDLQEVGRQVIKLLGAPALAKILKSNGLKNLSSADPEDYPTLYAEIKELIND